MQARPNRGAKRARSVLFASAHSVVDFSNGASVATLDVLAGLAGAGFRCQAFCTSKLDFQGEARVDDVVTRWASRTRSGRRSAAASVRRSFIRAGNVFP